MKKVIEFPLYRKYSNNHSFFKVISNASFEEIKKTPKGYTFHLFEIKILPDRHLIHDMIFDFEPHWQVITEEEYDRVKNLVG